MAAWPHGHLLGIGLPYPDKMNDMAARSMTSIAALHLSIDKFVSNALLNCKRNTSERKWKKKTNNALMLSGDHAEECPVLQCVGAFRRIPYSSMIHRLIILWFVLLWTRAPDSPGHDFQYLQFEHI